MKKNYLFVIQFLIVAILFVFTLSINLTRANINYSRVPADPSGPNLTVNATWLTTDFPQSSCARVGVQIIGQSFGDLISSSVPSSAYSISAVFNVGTITTAGMLQNGSEVQAIYLVGLNTDNSPCFNVVPKLLEGIIQPDSPAIFTFQGGIMPSPTPTPVLSPKDVCQANFMAAKTAFDSTLKKSKVTKEQTLQAFTDAVRAYNDCMHAIQ